MNSNIFVSEQMRTLRTALVNLNEYLEKRGLVDLSIDVPTHPKAGQVPRFPSTVDEWVLRTAIDLDILNMRLRMTPKKARAKRSAS